jgi:predicted nucleotidyltransferase
MPVRSLNSPVFKWPTRQEAHKAFLAWGEEVLKRRPDVIKLGYFGSYARGDWGVGSDLDLIAIVESEEEVFEKRSVGWEIEQLPVPATLLVYTVEEWNQMRRKRTRFALAVEQETVWLHQAVAEEVKEPAV